MVETYGSGKMIADSLNYNFHLVADENTAINAPCVNLSVLSRFPLGERFDFYNYFNIGGIEVFLNDSVKNNVFTTWLNYQPWEDNPLLHKKTPDELIKWEKSVTHEAELDTIIKGLKPFWAQSDEIPVIMGGDFNMWSHLDWQDDVKDEHNGMTVNRWTTSTIEKLDLLIRTEKCILMWLNIPELLGISQAKKTNIVLIIFFMPVKSLCLFAHL